MEGKWPYLTLDKLAESPITYGVVKPGPEDPSGIRFIRGGDVADGRINVEALRTITPDISEQYKRTLLHGGEIVVSLVGNPGQVAIVPESLRGANIARQVGLVRLSSKIDPRFVKYFLLSPQGQDSLGTRSMGSVQQVINLRDLRTVKIPVPPLQEQQAIACILGAMDDKIELNRRMNQTLEGMARAIFKSWFVDFDPVRAKAAGQQPPSLAPHVADLFPSEFEESNLGEIPRGWRPVALGSMVETTKGRSYKSSELVESDAALVTLKSFARGGGYRPEGLKSYSGTYRPKQVVEPGELVIACTDVTQAAEVIGRPAIVRKSRQFNTLVASLDTLIVRPHNSAVTRSFLYFLCGTYAFTAHTYAYTTGTTVLHLAKDAIPSFKFAQPPSLLVQVFDRLAVPILGKLDSSATENDLLAATRDTLLPKLISGELRVSDTERIIGRTL